MSIIRYQAPDAPAWPLLNRWSNLRDDLNTLFELPLLTETFRRGQLFNGWSPALDLYQNNDEFIATLELPGMRKEDIEISIHDGTLTISGERKLEKKEGERVERSERYVGKFRRSITLPARVDVNKVNASYEDGILTVTLAKAEDARPKQIKVNVG